VWRASRLVSESEGVAGIAAPIAVGVGTIGGGVEAAVVCEADDSIVVDLVIGVDQIGGRVGDAGTAWTVDR
jgi:hypothetical protein